jgi:hypothetical protein
MCWTLQFLLYFFFFKKKCVQRVLFFFEKKKPFRSFPIKMVMIPKWIHKATLC